MDKTLLTFPPEEAVLQVDEAWMFEEARRDAALDEALRDTFPASDPVALTFRFQPSVILEREHRDVSVEFFKHTHPRHLS